MIQIIVRAVIGGAMNHCMSLQLDDLPSGNKVLRPDGDQINAFPKGGEVELMYVLFHIQMEEQLAIG